MKAIAIACCCLALAAAAAAAQRGFGGGRFMRLEPSAPYDGAKAKELIALYRRVRPGITNTDVWLIMNADNTGAPTRRRWPN